MKKVLSVLLALGMVLCSCACTAKDNENTHATTTTTQDVTSAWNEEDESVTSTTNSTTGTVSEATTTTTKKATASTSKTTKTTKKATTTTKKPTTTTKKATTTSKVTTTTKKLTTTTSKATTTKKKATTTSKVTTTTTKATTATTQHVHQYDEATCLWAAECSCGAIKGSALGHDWSEKVCRERQVCKRCGAKKDVIDHHYLSSGVCEYCGKKAAKEIDGKITVGDRAFFGTYEQDNNTANGKEAILWHVLKVEDGNALVISEFALDRKVYNSGTYSNVTWETCSLRKWLNSEFLNTAFSATEKAKIPTVTVSADKNPLYSTNPGNATQDKVFLLSITEAEKYFSSDISWRYEPTDYAIAKGAYKYVGTCFCWLRSPGKKKIYAVTVYDNGTVNEYGEGVSSAYIAVRPALWVELNA